MCWKLESITPERFKTERGRPDEHCGMSAVEIGCAYSVTCITCNSNCCDEALLICFIYSFGNSLDLNRVQLSICLNRLRWHVSHLYKHIFKSCLGRTSLHYLSGSIEGLPPYQFIFPNIPIRSQICCDSILEFELFLTQVHKTDL